jgi:hypothetical protein
MPDLGVFSRYKSLTDYLNENEERKAKMAQQERLARGGSDPAALQIADRRVTLHNIMNDPNATPEQKRQAAYEDQMIVESGKLLEKNQLGFAGQNFDVYGAPAQPMTDLPASPNVQPAAPIPANPPPLPTQPSTNPPPLPADYETQPTAIPPELADTPPINLGTPVTPGATVQPRKSTSSMTPGGADYYYKKEELGQQAKADVERAMKPGTEAEVTRQTSNAKYMEEGRQNLPKLRRAIDNARISEDTALRTIKQVSDRVGSFTTGFGGSIMSLVPGSEAHTLKADLTRLLADTGFNKLMEIKSASATGGALGSVTEKELDLLQASVTAMWQSTTKEDFMNNLRMYEQHRAAVLHNLELDYRENYNRFGGQQDPNLRGPDVPTATPSQFPTPITGNTLKTTVPSGQDIPTINTPEEARKLPPNTKFRTPDGRILRTK